MSNMNTPANEDESLPEGILLIDDECCENGYFGEKHECLKSNPANEWEEWVRVLANSKNPHDTDLLIAKIKVLLDTERARIVERIEAERKPEKVIEDCENCGAEGYGKAWYGRGRETGDAWGDRYTPTGSVVFCKDCAKDFRIGREWNGEEIWKTTSDDPQHAELRISRITKTVNREHNQALDQAIDIVKNK